VNILTKFLASKQREEVDKSERKGKRIYVGREVGL
jgi:hypothetical protein